MSAPRTPDPKSDFVYVSTSRMDHPPVDAAGKRRPSYACIIEYNEEKPITYTYTKDKHLGTGGFGSVFLMQPVEPDRAPIVVKEYVSKKYELKETNENIESTVKEGCELVRGEAKFNEMLRGFGKEFSHSYGPIKINIGQTKKTVEGGSKVWVAQLHINGTEFYNYKVKSTLHYFDLCIATLIALIKMNLKFIHNDIKNTNVMVCVDKEGKITVEFVDFTLSALKGQKVRNAPNVYQPPEFGSKIHAHENQDLYSTGYMLALHYDPSFFDKATQTQVNKLLESMQKKQPALRITSQEALERFQTLRAVELRESTSLRERIMAELTRTADFSVSENIDKWCHYKKLLKDYEKKDADENKLGKYFRELKYSTIHDNTGIKAFIENSTSPTEALFEIIKEVKSPEQYFAVLSPLDSSFLFSRLLSLEEFKTKLNQCSEEEIKLLYLALFKIKQNEFAELIGKKILEEKIKAKVIDQWCYVERFIHELNIGTETVAARSRAGMVKIIDANGNWSVGVGLQRLRSIKIVDTESLVDTLKKFPTNYRIDLLKKFGEAFLLKKTDSNADLQAITGTLEFKDQKKLYEIILPKRQAKLLTEWEGKDPTEAMDKWCYIESFHHELVTNLLDMPRALNYYSHLTEEKWDLKGKFRLMNVVLTTEDNLLKTLSHLSQPTQQMQLLHYLGTDIIEKLIKSGDHLYRLIKPLSAANKKEVIVALGDNYFPIGKVDQFHILEHFREVFAAQPSEYDQQCQNKMSLEDMKDLFSSHANAKKFLAGLDNTDPTGQRSALFIQRFVKKLIDNDAMLHAVRYIDKFANTNDKNITYKRFLLACNKEYYVRREATPAEHYTSFGLFGKINLFGRYSKTRKLSASIMLEEVFTGKRTMQDVPARERGAFDSGELKRIAKRLKRCAPGR